MTRRKTYPVAKLLERVNYLLANHDVKVTDVTPEQAYRMGAASVLRMVLHDTGNYKGFGYLDVNFNLDPPHIPDESRQVYYGRP